MKRTELLAPAGTLSKAKIAFYYGADAIYFAGKKFGLRAFAQNFDDNEMSEAIEYAHKLGKKVYITVNILAHEDDFNGLPEYILKLQELKADAIIVSDLGIISMIREIAPQMEIHVSTQANILNSHAINFLAKLGVKRIILARELSIEEIKKIRRNISDDVSLECFVHGAMCISYSGRCLLSNYMANRDSNRGECVQTCRWEYAISEKNRQGEYFPIEEDQRGTYILNSKDMCMIEHIEELINAGVASLKIEGRMKSEYYVATVVNAYRRAIDSFYNKEEIDLEKLKAELEKASHRKYTTGFYLGAKDKENFESSMPKQTYKFVALVLEEAKNGFVKIEQRNSFKVGDVLEVLSPGNNFNKTIQVELIKDEFENEVTNAKLVQQTLFLKTNLILKAGDILRMKLS
ncbi:MAG: U32 family peptidase [Clostridia bacterium]|nr:U32 family peptidase [Clostridia bacterium]MDD4685734.1 U32 family peptidase [Clostridia bacterium]